MLNLAGLDDTQKVMRESVLELLRRELPEEKIRELDEKGEFPSQAYDALAAAGWMGLFFSEEFGGMGGSHKDLTTFVEALGYHYGGITVGYLQTAVNAAGHLKLGSKELQQMVLPKIISGEVKLALSMTEPGAGSDAAAITTRAVRDGDEYVLTGQKLYTTCAHVADYLIVSAKTAPELGRRGISMFLVDAKAPGITINRIKTLGRNTSATNEVFYDNVRTPASWLIGEENGGWGNLMKCLNVERLGICAMGAGDTFRILDDAIAYAKDRVQFGQALSDFQVIQHKLADIRILGETARLYSYRVAELLDGGHDAVTETAMAKVVATEANFEAADIGMQILGGAGYTMEYGMQRHFRDSRITRIGGGASEVMKNVIAKRLGV